MRKIINWLTIRLMSYQLEKAKESYKEEENSIIKSAKRDMVKCFEGTIIYLDAIN